MTLREIKASDKVFLNAADIAGVLKCDPNYIRWMAHHEPEKLGFPVLVMKSRIKINRKLFLQSLGETEDKPKIKLIR